MEKRRTACGCEEPLDKFKNQLDSYHKGMEDNLKFLPNGEFFEKGITMYGQLDPYRQKEFRKLHEAFKRVNNASEYREAEED